MADLVYSLPRPTYPVAYNGELVSGGWFSGLPGTQVTIPRIHRREGDLEDNPVASYLLTVLGTSANFTFVLGQLLYVYDSISSTPGVVIWSGNYTFPMLFTFDCDLRMACVGANVSYFVLARYYLPLR